MKLHQMYYFDAVCRLGSVSRAAEELHISQPSVSSSIRELEQEFNIALFHRIKKRLVLTSEGEYFLSKIQPILSLTDELSQEMSQLGNKQNQLKLGVPPMIGTILFPSMFKTFKPMYPDIRLDILEFGSKQTIELVAGDVLDMAIVITNGLETSSFHVIDILETQMVLCVQKNHPLSKCTSVDLNQLTGEPLILLKEDSYQNMVLKQRFDTLNMNPDILTYSNQLTTVERFICEGIASAFLFPQLIKANPEITGIPLTDPIPIKIGLIWKKEKKISGSISRFIEFTSHYRKYYSS